MTKTSMEPKAAPSPESYSRRRDCPGLCERLASSIAENLYSRLRNYFFLRRELSNGYLDLLRFFLNHRRFALAASVPPACAGHGRQGRVGKSPTELLTGRSHPHWLELTGLPKVPSELIIPSDAPDLLLPQSPQDYAHTVETVTSNQAFLNHAYFA